MLPYVLGNFTPARRVIAPICGAAAHSISSTRLVLLLPWNYPGCQHISRMHSVSSEVGDNDRDLGN
jgi:hypothetical protein